LSSYNSIKFIPAIEAPYRWRDWGATSEGLTGDALIAFINQDEAMRPDGTRGQGLFKYLRELQGNKSHDRRDTIAAVFRGMVNRMINGYLLRDVLTKLNGIHFNASEELEVLGRTYETLLKEMRDAAGDAGEFYTPRPVVRLMVELINPLLGEIVLDPACGTGGFLVESYSHLAKQATTVQKRKQLQQSTIQGCEAKPLPYLLANMNLLLHGLESPDIDSGNALRFPLKEIGDKQRVDVILSNPPFGGEEERGILGNFPDDKQTAETALLFLQLIMRKLRRQSKSYNGIQSIGRAAVVVPNGTLFADGICGRIKQDLLIEFSLHTIVRLPNGVFAPYTNIPANLLFFERSGPTQDVWFYEQPLPQGRKNYTKTQPLQYEEFTPLLTWWNKREVNAHAWKIPAAEILAQGSNLDRKNPVVKDDITHLPPEQLVASILDKERQIIAIMEQVQALLKESL
jgi:type I restriction enzyme M protein